MKMILNSFMFHFCVILVVFSGVFAFAKEHDKLDDVQSSSVLPPTFAPITTTTTTAKPTTTSTTEKPTTTSTTEKPKTTTSTTEKPTTTTTTEKPSTTTVEPSTTTVAPPSPNKVGIWNVTEGSGNETRACIVASMTIGLVVQYETNVTNPKTNSSVLATVRIDVPKSAKSSGTCGNDSQSLELSWNQEKLNLSLKFTFTKKNESFSLSHIESALPVSEDLFPAIHVDPTTKIINLENVNGSASIPVKQSYTCLDGIQFNLTNSVYKKENASSINMTQVKFQAFVKVVDNKFVTGMDCAVPNIPDIIPIAVGLSLAALVIIVLVAYVIGRRRSAAHGYVSM